jgi:superfamily II DNA or RNA helicase
LLFHEDIQACDLIAQALVENGISCAQYHSRVPLWTRVQTLSDFRAGKFDVLVTCRALDEGFNVPEAEIGIIAASTASYRQRIQRLGRVLRHAPGKTCALIYSIVASTPEIQRLVKEAEQIEDLVEITWTRA